MRRFIRSAAIQQKLTLVIVCTSLVGLSLASLVFDAFERSSFRAAMTSEFSALAGTLGANTAAALAFNDRKSAEDTLGALRAEQHVIAASSKGPRGGKANAGRTTGYERGCHQPRGSQSSRFAVIAYALPRG